MSLRLGMVGLETAFPLLYTHLSNRAKLDAETVHDYMMVKPCAGVRLPGTGSLKPDGPCILCSIDLERDEKISIKEIFFFLKGKICSFDGISCCRPAGYDNGKGKTRLLKRGDL